MTLVALYSLLVSVICLSNATKNSKDVFSVLFHSFVSYYLNSGLFKLTLLFNYRVNVKCSINY